MAYSSGSITNTLALTLSKNLILQLCGRIWRIRDPYLVTDFEMIESIQKFANSVCLKQWSRETRYQDMLEVLNMSSLAAHWRQRKLCTLYKVVNNNLSEYPSPLLIPRDPYFSSCSVHCLSFVRPYVHTNQDFLFSPTYYFLME